MLEIEALTIHYGQALALEGISMTAPSEGLTAIVGPNGAGKTTTLRAISRLVKPTSGSITFNGQSLLEFKAHTIARMGIAHCPEGRKPFPDMSVVENLLMGGYVLPRLKVRDRLEHIFTLFPVLKQRSRQSATTLSGGEQQMLAIGRALMAEPLLLMIDEPTLGLSPLIVEEVGRITHNIKGDVSVLLAEGNIDLIRDVADKVYVFDHGSSVFCGTISELFNDAELSKSYLGM